MLTVLRFLLHLHLRIRPRANLEPWMPRVLLAIIWENPKFR